MRGALAASLLLLLGCRSPYGSFDAGHDVHVIVRADPPPRKGVHVRPVCTLGPRVEKSPPRVLGRGADAAAEVAVFRVAEGEHRLAIWEPRTWSGARATLDVDRETWVVVTIRPRERRGSLRVFDGPPGPTIGGWQPLVAVPD